MFWAHGKKPLSGFPKGNGTYLTWCLLSGQLLKVVKPRKDSSNVSVGDSSFAL